MGDGATVGDRAMVGVGATVGDRAMVGVGATVGDGARVGDRATVGDGARVEVTPLYIWPHGGKWPIYVSDPDKKLIGVGCEIHDVDFWINGGADKVREKRGVQDTAAIYDPALRAVAQLMGWKGA